MEGVRAFLESSSISGLNHISTTKKCARAFWIVVVLAAIIMSGLLIFESFESWSKSPVRTTIETLEMREIRFPKVTVCPPRNTFTDLNYEFMLGRNLLILVSYLLARASYIILIFFLTFDLFKYSIVMPESQILSS